VSIIDDFKPVEKENILRKYSLPENYFIVSNQFHRHKNHEVIFKAAASLKEMKIDIHFAITGKLPEKESSEYIQRLYALMEENQLQNRISILGVIPRNDQLNLMKYSQAVVQPSLFEGWSTVIEDAKSLQVPVIASDLDVNIEQLGDKGTYFSAKDEADLINKLVEFVPSDGKSLYDSYEERVKNYARKFIHIYS
jgi:glycosyltransferase involved in cell wall biosynthesis